MIIGGMKPSLSSTPYEIEDVVYNEPYTMEEILKAIEEKKDISKELTSPGRLLFLGLIRLNYCIQNNAITTAQVETLQKQLTQDYTVNKFNFDLWSNMAKSFVELSPYAIQFRKTKNTDTEAALDAAQEILNILYNLKEKL